MPERWTMRDADASQHDDLDRATPGGSGRSRSRTGGAFGGSFIASSYGSFTASPYGSRTASSHGSIWPLASRAIAAVVAGVHGDFGGVEIFSLKGISS